MRAALRHSMWRRARLLPALHASGLLLFSRFGGNTPAEVTSSSHVGGDLETLKQELLTEMRQELQKVKDEIVQGWN